MEQFDYIRESLRYADFHGTDESGMPIIYMDSYELPESESQGQLIRDAPLEIRIKFRHDEQGRAILKDVETEFTRYQIANNGQVLLKTGKELKMQANWQDKLDFVAMFWERARRFISNGRIRKILGCNYLSLFLPTGAVNVLTAEQEALPGTGNYDTHRVDGTPINPESDDTL